MNTVAPIAPMASRQAAMSASAQGRACGARKCRPKLGQLRRRTSASGSTGRASCASVSSKRGVTSVFSASSGVMF
jgi:hypothetical protein